MLPDPAAPETGNEDEGFLALLEHARANCARTEGEPVPEITVTAACIGRADPLDPNADAIALAARDAFPGATRITTGYLTLFVSHGARVSRYPLPDSAQRFTEQCRAEAKRGSGSRPEPFSFTVTEMAEAPA